MLLEDIYHLIHQGHFVCPWSCAIPETFGRVDMCGGCFRLPWPYYCLVPVRVFPLISTCTPNFLWSFFLVLLDSLVLSRCSMPLLEAVRYRFSCFMVLIVLVTPYADTPELLMLWRVTLGIIPASFFLLESSCLSLTPQCHRLAGTTSSTLWWPCYTGFPLRNILYSHM